MSVSYDNVWSTTTSLAEWPVQRELFLARVLDTGRACRDCLNTFPTANFLPLLCEVEERAGERRRVFIGIPLSSILSPLVPRGARKNINRF
jgi:hypothetical protein